MKYAVFLVFAVLPLFAGAAEIERIWLTHKTNDPSKIVDTYPMLFRSTPFMPVLGNHAGRFGRVEKGCQPSRRTTWTPRRSVASSSYRATSGSGTSTCPSSIFDSSLST